MGKYEERMEGDVCQKPSGLEGGIHASLTYIFVILSNILYYARYKKGEFQWFLNGFVPIVGILVLALILCEAFFVSLWGIGFALGQSVLLP